jgi:hypothetical protein
LEALPTVVCRLLPAPATFRNLCVDEVKFSRSVVGADRPVRIDVKVSNTGDGPSDPSAVEIIVDGSRAGRQPLEEIPAGASQSVHFLHQFERPGPKTVEARLEGADDLPGDNSAFARLNVLEELPVLIIEGSPSPEPFGDASAFVQIALAPGQGSTGVSPVRSGTSVPTSTASTGETPVPPPARDLVRATVINAADLAAGHDLGRYRAVILAGAPILPEVVANELGAFVQRGGGLLILPGDFKAAGDRSSTHFYDTWTCAGGKAVCPARMLRRLADIEPAVHPAVQTFAHPALDILADPARNYSGSVLIRSYWELQIDEKDPDVRVGGRLDTAHPFLVDRKLGEGHVLLLCASLDHRQSNLPAIRPFFVPLVHEMVYYLAGAMATYGNVESGQEASLDVPAWLSDPAAGPGRMLEIITPLGSRLPARIEDIGGVRRLVFPDTDAPGVYRIVVPSAPKAAPNQARKDDLFFVVPNQPQESRLDRLAPADLQGAQKHVPVKPAANAQELSALVHGGTPGLELHKYLALVAAIALVAEIALTHWIARRRKAHGAMPVAFGEEPLDIATFRKHAKEMLAVPQPEGSQAQPADGGAVT